MKKMQFLEYSSNAIWTSKQHFTAHKRHLKKIKKDKVCMVDCSLPVSSQFLSVRKRKNGPSLSGTHYIVQRDIELNNKVLLEKLVKLNHRSKSENRKQPKFISKYKTQRKLDSKRIHSENLLLSKRIDAQAPTIDMNSFEIFFRRQKNIQKYLSISELIERKAWCRSSAMSHHKPNTLSTSQHKLHPMLYNNKASNQFFF